MKSGSERSKASDSSNWKFGGSWRYDRGIEAWSGVTK
jgi:hypothetical protein